MELIDTHCHLANGRLLPQVPQVLERAREAGLVAVVCVAADLREARTARELAAAHREVFFTAGVHPHAAQDAREGYLGELERLAGLPKHAAVGEIGLDYHYNYSPPEAQRRVFAEQLALALRLGKNVVVHTREALDDTLAVVRESRIEGYRLVFHSFTEGPESCRRVLELGATVSFSGIVTFAGADDLRRSAALVPDDRLLVETDAPFLSPEPVRKMKTNEPAYVAHVAACLAAIRGVSPDALAALTTANARRFFQLDRPENA